MSTVLAAGSAIPGPGWAFRITALHTAPATPPWFTGTWHQPGEGSCDPP